MKIVLPAVFILLLGPAMLAADGDNLRVPIADRVDGDHLTTSLNLWSGVTSYGDSLSTFSKRLDGKTDEIDNAFRKILRQIEKEEYAQLAEEANFPKNYRIVDASQYGSMWKKHLFGDPGKELFIIYRIPTSSGAAYLLQERDESGEIVIMQFIGDDDAGYRWSPVAQDPLLSLLQDNLKNKNLATARTESQFPKSDISSLLRKTPPDLTVEGALLSNDSPQFKMVKSFVEKLDATTLRDSCTTASQKAFDECLESVAENFRKDFLARFIQERANVLSIVNGGDCFFVIYAPVQGRDTCAVDTVVLRDGQCKLANFYGSSNLSVALSKIGPRMQGAIESR